MENEADKKRLIKEKEAEIAKYKDVLSRYKAGRWLSMGKRHLEQLNAELKDLTDATIMVLYSY